MRALSIRQPWAHAILNLGKNIENRTWNTKFRGDFWVHASAGMRGAEYAEACKFLTYIGRNPPDKKHLTFGAIVGRATLTDVLTVTMRDDEATAAGARLQWFQGPFGFVLKNIVALREPVPCKGALGFFSVPEDLERAALTELYKVCPPF